MPKLKKKMIKEGQSVAVEEIDHEEVEVTSSFKLPEQYVLNSGDKFIPFDEANFPDGLELDNYYATSDETVQPTEEATGDTFVIGKTLWHRADVGKVFEYRGKETDGNGNLVIKWEESFTAPHYVIDLGAETDEAAANDTAGGVLGEIVNRRRKKTADIETKVQDRMRELTSGHERTTLEDILKEI